ncbi:MAG: SGNH/GDSL hydrolase family protein, partial [Prevotella sp.]
MKRYISITVMAVVMLFFVVGANGQDIIKSSNGSLASEYVWHPWFGKRVAYLGDSITDPNSCSDNVPKKYWGFLNEWLDITPYVYGVSGRQWNDIPRQVEKLKKEHGDDVDAIIVFIGTNDYNAGVPVGRWFTEYED